MDVLVPIDGSECSYRALDFATEFVNRYKGNIHVIHITDYEGERTDEIISEAEKMLEEAGLASDPEIVTDLKMSDARYANQVGKDILEIVDEQDYDHVIMGHHGTGRIGRALLGSAAETVVRATEVPSTIIP